MTRRVSLRIIGAVVAAAWLLTRASGAPAAAAAGAPVRIISLVPATTEMLYDMGAGKRLIGVSSYSRFPAETQRLHKLGGLLNPDVEPIIALAPDLVIVYGTQTELRRQLERASIATFVYSHRGLADITDTMRVLGARIGESAAGQAAAARLDASLAAVRTRVANRPRPKTLLIFGREAGTLRGIRASGGYGFLHDLLELAGAADAVADVPRESLEMSTETILARAPDVVVELHYGASASANDSSDMSAWNRLAAVPAVRNHRVHLLVGDEFVVPGPRLAAAAAQLARVIHPEAFR